MSGGKVSHYHFRDRWSVHMLFAHNSLEAKADGG